MRRCESNRAPWLTALSRRWFALVRADEVTYLAMLEGTRRVLAGDAPVGFQTPALAYGEAILEASLGQVAWHDE